MEEKEYIKLCNDSDFETWLKTKCICDSFNNIEEGRAFRTIVFNKKIKPNGVNLSSVYIEDYNGFLIQYKDNIKMLHDTLNYSDNEDFIINDDTCFFIFSYPFQLNACELIRENYRIYMIKSLEEADED